MYDRYCHNRLFHNILIYVEDISTENSSGKYIITEFKPGESTKNKN